MLVGLTRGYWCSRGLIDVGYRLASDAVSRVKTSPASVVHARALFCTGELAYFLGRHLEAHEFMASSMAMARTIGNEEEQAWSQGMLAITCLGLHRDDEARIQARDAHVSWATARR